MKSQPDRRKSTSLCSRNAIAVAIVGGSGSGKSWFADRLARKLGEGVVRLNLDNFYRDRSHLTLAQRARLNFDNPVAIDWSAFEESLLKLLQGKAARIPTYDFSTHARGPAIVLPPGEIIIADGLWLLRKAGVRRLFDLSIYLNCPACLRLERRLNRDTATRGRTPSSVKQQFRGTVQPMHARFVEPQRDLADFVFKAGEQESGVHRVASIIRAMCSGAGCV